MELDDCLDHADRGRIGGGVGATELAGHSSNLGTHSNHAILPSHHPFDFVEGDTGVEDRHQQKATLVEPRHEFDDAVQLLEDFWTDVERILAEAKR